MSRRRRKRKAIHTPTPLHDGPQPTAGMLATSSDAKPPTITLFAFGKEQFHEQEIKSMADVHDFIGKWPVIWVNIDGLADSHFMHELGDIFSLHELALEDVLAPYQRAKVEPYANHLFIVLRMLSLQDGYADSEQMSIFLGDGFLVSCQEKPDGDCLNPVRERIRKGYGHVREEGADYLLYLIVDAIIDGYFPLLELIGDTLEKLEDEVLDSPERHTPARIMDLKRDVVSIRRAIWPARDAVNMLMREDTSPLLGARTRIYMRDCYDHAMRIIDMVETQREACSDLMELYLSRASNKMNEIMKVLTIVSLLFLPPTLVSSIYGMNFNTQVSPYNMPELHWYFGYQWALGLMLCSALTVAFYAHRRGWIGSADPKTKS